MKALKKALKTLKAWKQRGKNSEILKGLESKGKGKEAKIPELVKQAYKDYSRD